MQLQTYMKILWRRGWIMVLLAVLTAAAAFGFSLIIKERAPLYQSTIKILVQPARQLGRPKHRCKQDDIDHLQSQVPGQKRLNFLKGQRAGHHGRES